MAAMTEVLGQPERSPGPGGERQPEEPEGKRAPNTGARLWGRVRSKLLRQKVLRERGVAAGDTAGLRDGSAGRFGGVLVGGRIWGGCGFCVDSECRGVCARSGEAVWVLRELFDAVGSL